MNNDLNNNHSSMSSNNYIANRRRNPIENQYYQEYYNKDKNRGMFDIKSKGNRTIFFDSDNDKRPSNQKDLLISRQISKYPTNYAPGPNPYNAEIIKGYILGNQEDPRYNKQYPNSLKENEDDYDDQRYNYNYYRPNIKNGGDNIGEEDGNIGEDEEEMENGNENDFNENIDYSPQQPIGQQNAYIGDGIVRNNIPDYSPNSNGQRNPYYKKKNLGKYIQNYGPENENENEEIKYITGSPEDNYNMKKNNNQPYKRRRILGNLADSASSEAYAKKKIQVSPSNHDSNSIIYVKPRTQYNNMNNGISTEERGIESRKDSPINADNNGAFIRRPFQYRDYQDDEKNKYNRRVSYDKDTANDEIPSYNYQNNDINKGGKVDLNNFAILKKRGKREKEEDEDEDKNKEERKIKEKYNIDEERLLNIINFQKAIKSFIEERKLRKLDSVIKLQSFWRGRCTRKIMKLYLDLDEFIYLLSKVHFNHFSDNFYFFINQLFNTYKANTLDNNQIDLLDEEKEENEDDNINNSKEDEKLDPNKKNYEDLLKDYNSLQKKYNDLINDNKFNKSGTKKSLLNNDINSIPGETTIGTIKTHHNKLKFKNPNNSAININNNENLTFSNEYNDNENEELKNKERHFYTPNQEDEDTFNEKDKRFSYSSLHSEENSKYFDNENYRSNKKKIISYTKKDKNTKVTMLILKKTKEKLFAYSPSTENDKQSRENSRNKKNNDSINDNKINNISVIMPKHEEEFGILKSEPEQNEGKIYDKYVRSFSKDLHIVKNNKIDLKNENNKGLYQFDNELMFPENENNMELVAPKKSDAQKIKEIFDNEKLMRKIENKISKKFFPEQKLSKKNESSFSVKNKNPKDILDKIDNEIEQNINNLEIIQNNHRNFNPSKLDFESNELSLGKPQKLQRKKKRFRPIFENEINIKSIHVKKLEAFSKEKTLPSYNDDEEKNTFTIKKTNQKNESKPNSFNNDQMIADNIYKFKLNGSEINSEKENMKKEKEIIYLPFKENAFKRLRRSKRTKENYFTIKKDSNYNKDKNKLEESKYKDKKDIKKDIMRINENNFEIKSEYYYIETDDKQIPEIIEKKIKKTIIIEHTNQFDNEKVLLSKENNFNIKADKNKNKYLEDIEKNELMIPSKKKDKKLKKDEYDEINPENNKESDKAFKNKRNYRKRNIKTVNKNEDFIIAGENKKWEDLNPIANEEFSIKHDLNDEKNIYENINKEVEENEGFIDNQNIYMQEYINIEPVEQFEIIDKNNEKDKNKLMKKSNQNSINIEGITIDKEDKELQTEIKPFKITTKKIVKHETILSRKKFLDNKISFEDSFPIYGDINKNTNYISDKDDENNQNYKNNEDNKKELILLKEPVYELTFKGIKKKNKDKEIEAISGKEFDDIKPITNNEFIIKKKQIQKEEKETEIQDDLNDNANNQNEITLDKIRNENLAIKGKKKKMKDAETQIDDDSYKLKPYYKDEIEINGEAYPKKEKNSIIKNESIGIIAPEKESEDNKNKDIILEKEKINEINLESRNRAFPKLDINNYLSETFKQNKKEKIEFETIKNESIMFEPNKKDKESLEKEKYKEFLIDYNQLTILPKRSKSNSLEKNIIPEKKEEIPRIFHELDINKSEEYNVKGKEKEIEKKKKKKKMVESETQIDDDLINNNYQPNDNINNNKIFSNIDIEKCNEQTIYGEKKEKEILDNDIPQSNNLEIAKEKTFEIMAPKDNLNKNDLLMLENAINCNYKPKNNKKSEAGTDTDNLNEIYNNKNKKIKIPIFEIENNNEIELTNEKDLLNQNELNKEINDQFTIKRKNKKKLIENETQITDELYLLDKVQNNDFSLLSSQKGKKKVKEASTSLSLLPLYEIKENDFNIRASRKKKLDKDIQIEPVKELEITTEKTEKKEIMDKTKFLNVEYNKIDSFSLNSQKNISKENAKEELNKPEKVDTCSVGTQTPKLRPPNKAPQKVYFHEIKTIIKKEQKPQAKYEISNSSCFNLIPDKKNDKNDFEDKEIIIEEIKEDKEKDEEDEEEEEEEDDDEEDNKDNQDDQIIIIEKSNN